MTIETKYNRADTVWLMQENKAIRATVEEIHIVITGMKAHIVYVISGTNIKMGHKVEESYLYKTKEELLASL